MPRLCGRNDPRLESLHFFLLGFEGERSYGTYYRFEPDHVAALVAKPGYKRTYYQEAMKRNAAFLNEASPDPILHAHAGDAIETWRKLHVVLAENKGRYNIRIIPLGTKPHALGGALAAFSHGTAGVFYLMPKAWKYRDVDRGKYIWKYEISM